MKITHQKRMALLNRIERRSRIVSVKSVVWLRNPKKQQILNMNTPSPPYSVRKPVPQEQFNGRPDLCNTVAPETIQKQKPKGVGVLPSIIETFAAELQNQIRSQFPTLLFQSK
jgi:hypothetical protein